MLTHTHTHTHTNKQSTRPKYPPRPTRALSAGAVTRKRSSRDQRSAAPLQPAQKTPGESVYSLTVHVAVCCVCLQLIVCLSFDLYIDLGDIVQVGTNVSCLLVLALCQSLVLSLSHAHKHTHTHTHTHTHSK